MSLSFWTSFFVNMIIHHISTWSHLDLLSISINLLLESCPVSLSVRASVCLSVCLACVPVFPLPLHVCTDVNPRHAVINHIAALFKSRHPTALFILLELHGWVVEIVGYTGDVIVVQTRKMMQLKGDWGALLIKADRKEADLYWALTGGNAAAVDHN